MAVQRPARRPAPKSGGNLTGLIVLLAIILLAGGGVGGFFFFQARAKAQGQQEVLDAVFKECDLARDLFHKGEFNSAKEHAEISIDLIAQKREQETAEKIPEDEQLQDRAIGFFWVGRVHVRRFIEFRRIPSPLVSGGVIRWTPAPPEPAEQARRRDDALKALQTAAELPKDHMKTWHEPCLKGLIAFLKKEYAEAEKQLAIAAKDPECDPEVVLTLGHALFEQGKYKEAEEKLVPLFQSGRLKLIDGYNAAAKAIHFQALETMLAGKDPGDAFAKAVKLLAPLSNPLAAASRAEVLCDWGAFKVSQGLSKEGEDQMAKACAEVANVSTPEMAIAYGRTRAVYATKLASRGETTQSETNYREGLQGLVNGSSKHANDADLVSRLGRCAEAWIRYYMARDMHPEAAEIQKTALPPLDAAIAKNPLKTLPGLHLALSRAWVALLSAAGVAEAETQLEAFVNAAREYSKDEWVLMEVGRAHLELGDRALHEGGDAKKLYEAAIAQYDAVLALGTSNADVLIERGRAWLQLGMLNAKAGRDPADSLSKAIQDFTTAHERNALRYEPLGLRAAAHGTLARWKRGHGQEPKDSEEAALRDAEAALKINQEAPELYLERAKIHLGRGQALQAAGQDAQQAYTTALGELAQAINFRKSYYDAYTTRGEAYFAIAEIKRNMAQDPIGEYRSAIENMDVALGYRPKLARAFVLRGLSHLAIGEHQAGKGMDPSPHFKSAMDSFNKVAEFLPMHPDGYAYRAYCRVQQGLHLQNRGQNPSGEFDAAAADIEKAISIDNRHADALFARGTVAIFKSTGKMEKGEDPTADLVAATADLSASFDLTPRAIVLAQRGLGWLRLAQYQAIMGQSTSEALGKASADLEEAIKRDAGQVQAMIHQGSAWALRAMSSARSGSDPSSDIKAATDAANAVLKMRPKSSEAMIVRGQALLAAGDFARGQNKDPMKIYAAAASEFEAAFKANSAVLEPLLWKAWAHLSAAEFKELREEEGVPEIQAALKDLNQVITTNGQLARAYQLRALTLLMSGLAKKRRGAVPVESYKEALTDAEQAVTLNGSDPGNLAVRAAVRYHHGAWERLQGRDPNGLFRPAFEDCNKAIQDPTALAIRGKIYYAGADFGKALADFKAAAALSVRHAQDLRGFIAECEKRK